MTVADERRLRWRRIVFEHDTPQGRAYDVVLIAAIVASVVVVVIDSLPAIDPTALTVLLAVVGYGDIAPVTVLGRSLASALMVLGYAIIAVPTGIVTLELQRSSRTGAGAATECGTCGRTGHDADAPRGLNGQRPSDRPGKAFSARAQSRSS